MDILKLAFGLSFEDLYQREGIRRIDDLFIEHLAKVDLDLHSRLLGGRDDPTALSAKQRSGLLVDLAPQLDEFIARLFGIEAEVGALRQQHVLKDPLYQCKRQFVQRRAAKKIPADEADKFDGPALAAELESLLDGGLSELAFARQVTHWDSDPQHYASELELATRYAAWAVHTAPGQARWRDGVLFKVPEKIDPEQLVPVITEQRHGVSTMRCPEDFRHREGFQLTDHGMDLTQALDQANYCIWCHNQGKDSCSIGLRPKRGEGFRQNSFGIDLMGCPLEEKISEMNLAKSQGYAIGALAIVAVDNPLCAATGHRICNDCMKSCIYQRQEPVDIPQIETRMLKDVLALPWGFEIYSLLTRWTPLDLQRARPLPDSGYKVLVVGLGPAGFNLAHHLLNDGHSVVAIDGLKIEPLAEELSGVGLDGRRSRFRPIKHSAELYDELDQRVLAGFGGVAEYGITVRWDKNFLKLIRLLLQRRERFALFGGVRYGGTMTIDDALALGFDHIAFCAGAGKPSIIPMANNLAKGVRMASDFLMALQLTGAAKQDSLANLQLRLPAVVIGGGLTAIDAATEMLAYYPQQVEKFLQRYEILVHEQGAEKIQQAWNEEERRTADEFIGHARALRTERELAQRENRAPQLLNLLQQWGGVTLVYRRRLIDAPSYIGNHEEVNKALEEGIRIAECLSPSGIEVDQFGHAKALRLTRMQVTEEGALRTSDEEYLLPAATVLIAAGTQPNTVIGREDTAHIPPLDGKYFQAFDAAGEAVSPERIAKPSEPQVFMAHFDDGRAMSYWGDLHPSYAGNVVKAMAGTKQGYPLISRKLRQREPEAPETQALFAKLNDELRPRVHEVIRLTPTIIEVVIRAPAQARNFRPGQFFRLQNYETLAPRVDATPLAMEGIALTGAWVDVERGLVSTIVLEMGGSSSLCQLLQSGEPVVLMGPTGTATETPAGETVILVGGGLGNAVLFSIGQALRAAGSKVLYFAGYKTLADRYYVENIERAADEIVWCCDQSPGFEPSRVQDKSFVGNIVQAMVALGYGELGPSSIAMSDAERLIVIGSDRMMAAVSAARHDVLAPYLKTNHIAIGSINSPMQCMMKEICAQCLQRQRDPQTGEERIVFSCFHQDQPLDQVDFECLNTRLNQNAAQEKLTALWIERLAAATSHETVTAITDRV